MLMLAKEACLKRFKEESEKETLDADVSEEGLQKTYQRGRSAGWEFRAIHSRIGKIIVIPPHAKDIHA